MKRDCRGHPCQQEIDVYDLEKKLAKVLEFTTNVCTDKDTFIIRIIETQDCTNQRDVELVWFNGFFSGYNKTDVRNHEALLCEYFKTCNLKITKTSTKWKINISTPPPTSTQTSLERVTVIEANSNK